MGKLLIWFITIIGLLPAVYLSIECLMARASFAQRKGRPESAESSLILARSSIQIGPAKLRLSTERWPAILTMLSAMFVCVGLFFLLPNNPQKIRRDGLSQIAYYVDRVINSRGDHASVTISTLDGVHAVLLARRDHNL